LHAGLPIPTDTIPEGLGGGKRSFRSPPPDDARAFDGRWIAAERAAILLEEASAVSHAPDRFFARPPPLRDGDPDIRISRRDPERSFTFRRDDQRRTWPLHWGRLEGRILQMIIRPVVAQPLLPQQTVDHLHGFPEAINAGASRQRRETQPGRLVRKVFSRTDPEIEPPR
jgi:hypothetical protein